MLACLGECEARGAGKRLGRRCARRAQNAVLGKWSVLHDGNYSQSGIWIVGSWEERNRVSRICPWLVKVSFPVERATAVCGTAMFLASQEVAISLEAREIWSSDVFWGGVIWRVYLSEANMPSQGTLVFLCSCLHPYPCMLGSANVVDLLPEYMCLHTEVECAPFEAETDSHDNHLTEVVDCVLMVDMSLLPGGEYSHTFGRDLYPWC